MSNQDRGNLMSDCCDNCCTDPAVSKKIRELEHPRFFDCQKCGCDISRSWLLLDLMPTHLEYAPLRIERKDDNTWVVGYGMDSTDIDGGMYLPEGEDDWFGKPVEDTSFARAICAAFSRLSAIPSLAPFLQEKPQPDCFAPENWAVR